jgi:acetate kinase
MTDTILTLNAGSSSLKFALFDIEPNSALRPGPTGQIEDIGTSPHFIAKQTDGCVIDDKQWPGARPNYAQIIEGVLVWVEEHLGSDNLIAVGHRVVHGGPDHDRPQMVTPDLLTSLDRLVPLAPLHEPHNIAPMRAIARARPDLPQIACFDTAFHHDMPRLATRLAIPLQYETEGVRRYGFHGLSYEYIAGELQKLAPALSKGRVIVAHLGNGASLCAMEGGHSVDTTMGFSALDGLVMGTRCGNLDPGVVLYLLQQHGMAPEALEKLLYAESGLLGVSGISSDMRALLASSDLGAREAIALFVFRMAREIGALTSSLGGLDGLVFTAGIGEHAPAIRAMVCERLSWLGAKLDPLANARNDFAIGASDSRIAVHVIPTNEELMIARHTLEAIAPQSSQ